MKFTYAGTIRSIITVLAFLLPIPGFAQKPFADAIMLAKMVENGKFGDVEKAHDILKFYIKGNPEFSSCILTYRQLNANRLLLKYIPCQPGGINNIIDSRTSISPATLMGSAAGVDVTAIADGIAKFMVERAKEELNVVFFERLNQELKKKKELQILFPNSARRLSFIGDEVYNYSIFLTSIELKRKIYSERYINEKVNST